MDLKIQCPTCATNALTACFVEALRDDGLYDVVCPNGHPVLLATQTLRHEMLFEIALNAIRDRYFREAVMSFAASLERFYEFSTRVMLRARDVSPSMIEDAWKNVSKQSERQLGAFILLHVYHHRKLPQILPLKLADFRNRVAHQGILPSRDEATTFGEAVYNVIQQGVQGLREKHLAQVNDELSATLAARASKMGKRYPRTFLVSQTALNIIDDISSGYPKFQSLL